MPTEHTENFSAAQPQPNSYLNPPSPSATARPAEGNKDNGDHALILWVEFRIFIQDHRIARMGILEIKKTHYHSLKEAEMQHNELPETILGCAYRDFNKMG